MGMVKDYFGNEVKVGDTVLVTSNSNLWKHRVLKITDAGNLKLSSFVKEGTDNWVWRSNNDNISEHNSFIYKQSKF